MRQLLIALIAAIAFCQPITIGETGCYEADGITECEAWEYAPLPGLESLTAKVGATWHNQPGK